MGWRLDMRTPFSAAAAAGFALLVLATAAASAALAKEGGTVALSAPIPADAQPGSTVSVTWTAYVKTEDGQSPIYGSPVFIRLIGRAGEVTEEMGHEIDRGVYSADVRVPAGGISAVEFGLRGTGTDTATGEVTRMDVMFEADGQVLAYPGAKTEPKPNAEPAKAAEPENALEPAASPESHAEPAIPVQGVILVLAAAAALALVGLPFLRRRRVARTAV